MNVHRENLFFSDSPCNLQSHTSRLHAVYWARFGKIKAESKPNSLVDDNLAASKHDRIDLSVMHAIIDGNQPFTFANYCSTRALLALTAPSYKVKSRHWYQQVRSKKWK